MSHEYCEKCRENDKAKKDALIEEEMSALECDKYTLLSEIGKLKDKIRIAEERLSELRGEISSKTKTYSEEILPWHYSVSEKERHYLSSYEIDKHTRVFRRFLLGYAVCLNVNLNKWLWYEWTQKLWVSTKGDEMTPLLVRLISEFKSRGLELCKNLTRNNLYLRDVITNLKVKLPDFAGIQYKINQNYSLISLVSGKVMDVNSEKIRPRTREDYFSTFITNGVVNGPSKIDLPDSIKSYSENLEFFFRGVVIPNTNKNKQIIGILSSQLYGIYKEWCNERQFTPESRRALIGFLQSRGFDRKRMGDGFHWLGIDGAFL